MIKIFEYQYFGEVVSLIALIISIASFIYARAASRYDISITGTTYTRQGGNPYLIFFTIINTSSKAITLEKITLFNNEDNEVKPLNHEPSMSYSEVSMGFGSVTKIPNMPPSNW